jgi:hypothetical protein
MLPFSYNSIENGFAARNAMAHGVKIFPCRAEDDKFGRIKSPLTGRGYHDAACDYNQLQAWRLQYPSAVYGLPCAPNGLFVIDADRHGSGDGVEALRALFDYYRFDWRTVPCVRTPNNGLHVIFQRQQDLGKTLGKIVPAVDTRDNGYVILPGSVMADGRRYTILNGTIEHLGESIANRWLPTVPDWLKKLIEHKPVRPVDRNPPKSMERQRRQLEGVLRSVTTATCGERNKHLHWAACRLGEAVGQGSIRFGDAEALLIQAGLICGLSEAEVRGTVRSGLQKTMSEMGHG